MSHAYDPHEVPDPFGDAQPPRRTPYLLLGVLAVLVLSGLCCVGSCVGLAILGFQIGADQVAAQVRNVPEFKAEIGELRAIKIKFSKSSNDGDNATFFYDVQGSEGSGELFVRVDEAPQGKIVREATLRTAAGKTVKIPIP
mgnify:CR=1 FL=1